MQRDFSDQRDEKVRGLRFAVALGLLAIGGMAVTAACGPSDEQVGAGGGECLGGVFNFETGQCEGKCTPDKCLPGNTCVGNRCLLKCDSHLDCYDTQDCTPANEDETQAVINVCKPHNHATGFGFACPFGTECGTLLACPDGTKCDQCGGNPAGCVLDATACAGAPGCNKGKCPDQSACVVPTCAAPTECKPLSCLGKGEGDADAYCSILHCESDAECPGGYFCGIGRDPHAICGLNKGNTARCGTTTEQCIDPANFTADGASYFEGQDCLLRKQCMKRGPCAPCASNLDCSQFQAQRCVLVGPDARCSKDCRTDGDCESDNFCVPNPTATDPMAGSCVPRFGACKGTGQFCEPCQDDTDCGPASSTVVCADASGAQRACVDRSFSTSCTSDADCPTSPSGKHGECLDSGEGYAPGDTVYQKCYFPFAPAVNKFGCW